MLKLKTNIMLLKTSVLSPLFEVLIAGPEENDKLRMGKWPEK
jgi:hypothetical protein